LIKPSFTFTRLRIVTLDAKLIEKRSQVIGVAGRLLTATIFASLCRARAKA